MGSWGEREGRGRPVGARAPSGTIDRREEEESSSELLSGERDAELHSSSNKRGPRHGTDDVLCQAQEPDHTEDDKGGHAKKRAFYRSVVGEVVEEREIRGIFLAPDLSYPDVKVDIGVRVAA